MIRGGVSLEIYEPKSQLNSINLEKHSSVPNTGK